MTCTRINGAIVCETPDFKPGDLPPHSELAPVSHVTWHAAERVLRRDRKSVV